MQQRINRLYSELGYEGPAPEYDPNVLDARAKVRPIDESNPIAGAEVVVGQPALTISDDQLLGTLEHEGSHARRIAGGEAPNTRASLAAKFVEELSANHYELERSIELGLSDQQIADTRGSIERYEGRLLSMTREESRFYDPSARSYVQRVQAGNFSILPQHLLPPTPIKNSVFLRRGN
jgi:hypothetical protein